MMGIAINSSGGVLVLLIIFSISSFFIDIGIYFFSGVITGHIIMMLIDKFALQKGDEQ